MVPMHGRRVLAGVRCSMCWMQHGYERAIGALDAAAAVKTWLCVVQLASVSCWSWRPEVSPRESARAQAQAQDRHMNRVHTTEARHPTCRIRVHCSVQLRVRLPRMPPSASFLHRYTWA